MVQVESYREERGVNLNINAGKYKVGEIYGRQGEEDSFETENSGHVAGNTIAVHVLV